MSDPKPAQNLDAFVDHALKYLRHLTVRIGPRPSTREGERQAAAYAAAMMRDAGLAAVRLEAFESGRSTYRPYALAVGAGLLGNLLYGVKPARATALAAGLLNALGAQGFAAEANFEDNWMRRRLPVGASQNVIGIVPAAGERRHTVVLLGHLDTHRTPIFYSSPAWLKLFSLLVGAAYAGLIVSSAAGAAGALSGCPPWRRRLVWVSRVAGAFQSFCLAMTLQADTSLFAVGANDNASGAATVLALGRRLAGQPLPHTEVWVVNTGCEELGAYGMQALLNQHEAALRDAYFLDFDMVGVGEPALLTREGLLRAYHPDAGLLALARQVAAAHPHLIMGEYEGGAYTDMGPAIKRGFRGVVISSRLPPGHPATGRMGYWHQSHDTFDKIERECLSKTHQFGWELLRHIDRQTDC